MTLDTRPAMSNPASHRVDDVLLAEPRGFCAGVDRAIEIVERALAQFGAPIYVRHERKSTANTSCGSRPRRICR